MSEFDADSRARTCKWCHAVGYGLHVGALMSGCASCAPSSPEPQRRGTVKGPVEHPSPLPLQGTRLVYETREALWNLSHSAFCWFSILGLTMKLLLDEPGESPCGFELEFPQLQSWEVRVKLFWDIEMERTMIITAVQLSVNVRKGHAMVLHSEIIKCCETSGSVTIAWGMLVKYQHDMAWIRNIVYLPHVRSH